MERLKPWLVGLVMAGCVAYYLHDRAAERRVLKTGPVAEIPLQSSASESSLQHAGYVIEPLASYDIRARVLSIERYRIGREADLSPVDFALGWGPMSDGAVLDKLTISQSNRWYHFRWQGSPPIDPTLMAKSSANTHLVPATDSVKDRLLKVSRGEVVRLSGYLISVRHADGWTWRSSLTRDDTGGGSCELMWVTDVQVEH
ncbi:MAG TPA: hypothetical protein VJU53_11210 [Burkholderiaceae bacterium]|nr:hypothetical protein [Burkholderiaceae bacterium]